MIKTYRTVSLAIGLVAVGLFLHVEPAAAQHIGIERPGDRDFIVDEANLIDPADAEQIRASCDQLLTEKGIPIIVVTIKSMMMYGMGGQRIETFATLLFNQWGIGYEELGGKSWNRGILLLVSQGDRRARIELGADWAHDFDVTCQQIMDEQIIPNFKQQKYSAGILAGVQGLDKMARGLPLPKRVRPWWHFALVVGLTGLAIFTAVSLIRRGASGWAWVFWAAVFALLGMLLYNMLRQSQSGGFSGGSFGGGFSGGGGASGSW